MDPEHQKLVVLILLAAAATFATRIGGYILITQLKTIPPRLEAALNAVPAAVLSTLFAPAFFSGQMDLLAALMIALIVGLRSSMGAMLIAGWGVVMAIRYFTG